MKHCNLTLPTPEENLACDEVLLDLCEEGHEDELLRFWEPSRYFVVLGYANKAATEVNLAFCRREHIPVFRRLHGRRHGAPRPRRPELFAHFAHRGLRRAPQCLGHQPVHP